MDFIDMYKHSNTSFSFPWKKKTKNFCSVPVTYFTVGNLNKMKGNYLLWGFYVVVFNLTV